MGIRTMKLRMVRARTAAQARATRIENMRVRDLNWRARASATEQQVVGIPPAGGQPVSPISEGLADELPPAVRCPRFEFGRFPLRDGERVPQDLGNGCCH